MQPTPEDILKQFDAALEENAVHVSLHGDYLKWLRYYLDFREKYPPPYSKSEQVRLFIDISLRPLRLRGDTGLRCVPD